MSTAKRPSESVPPQHLGSAFGTADRAAGLSGLLPKKAPAPAPPALPAQEKSQPEDEPPTSVSEASPVKPAPKVGRPSATAESTPARGSSSTRGSASDSPIKAKRGNYAVYLSGDVHAAATKRAKEERSTITLLTLAAIERQWDRLPDLLAKDAGHEEQVPVSRFTREPRQRRSPVEGRTTTQATLQLTPTNLAELKEAVQELGAMSRTHLADTALRADLLSETIDR